MKVYKKNLPKGVKVKLINKMYLKKDDKKTK